jgi:dipeptidyl aminopeptidase/acylaminoacyl peptidase
MMTSDRFERRLPEILEEISLPRKPDYFDDLVGLSARTRQRPAWSIPERWLPVADIARQPSFARQVPWRPIAVLTLILLLIVASLAWIAGSQHRLPAPFGPARTGLVVYAKDGDIFTADLVRGTATAIVKGPETDVDPQWSRDGTHVAFERQAGAVAGSGDVYVASADGSKPVRVTNGPLSGITRYDFSPDGTQLLIAADQNGTPGLFIAASDGTGIRHLEGLGRVTDAAWRPPDGSEILFMDAGTDDQSTDSGIYAVNAVNGQVRTILGANANFRGHPAWSPDGSAISFGEWPGITGLDVQTHIVKADGTGDRALPIPAGAVWQGPNTWSNDGTRLLAIRGYTSDEGQARPVVVPVDGSGPGLEIPFPGGIDTGSVSDWQWAPDDSSVLGTPMNPAGNLIGQVQVDPVKGTFETRTWGSPNEPSWQRTAQ